MGIIDTTESFRGATLGIIDTTERFNSATLGIRKPKPQAWKQVKKDEWDTRTPKPAPRKLKPKLQA